MKKLTQQSTHIQVPQNTLQWLQRRKGIPTASMFSEFINYAHKTGSMSLSESETAKLYKYQLVAERILQRPLQRKKVDTAAANHGREYEETAAQAFANKLKVSLDPGGFVTNGWAGCSPDRLIVGTNDAVEIKCPQPWTHCRYLGEGAEDAYELQVQGQLWIGGYDHVHFWSWSDEPNFPPVYRKTARDERFIQRLTEKVMEFARLVDKAEQKVIEAGAKPEPMRNE